MWKLSSGSSRTPTQILSPNRSPSSTFSNSLMNKLDAITSAESVDEVISGLSVFQTDSPENFGSISDGFSPHFKSQNPASGGFSSSPTSSSVSLSASANSLQGSLGSLDVGNSFLLPLEDGSGSRNLLFSSVGTDDSASVSMLSGYSNTFSYKLHKE